jgi:hypothetical protein
MIPSPDVEFPCGSVSMIRMSCSARAREAARLIAVVVFPTPPFWLTIEITLPMEFCFILHVPHARVAYGNTSPETVSYYSNNM